jgi:hypothetical protein
MRASHHLAILGLGLAVAASTKPARAENFAGFDAGAIGGALELVAVVGDVAFAVHDISAAGRAPASKGWAVGETIFAAPQTVFLNVVVASMAQSSQHDLSGLAGLVAVVPTTLSAHGVYALIEPATPARYGVAWAIGADAVFTNIALASLGYETHLPSRFTAALEIVATAPSAAVAAYEIHYDADHRAPWIALTAYSSALTLHGLASIVFQPSKPASARLIAPPVELYGTPGGAGVRGRF